MGITRIFGQIIAIPPKKISIGISDCAPFFDIFWCSIKRSFFVIPEFLSARIARRSWTMQSDSYVSTRHFAAQKSAFSKIVTHWRKKVGWREGTWIDALFASMQTGKEAEVNYKLVYLPTDLAPKKIPHWGSSFTRDVAESKCRKKCRKVTKTCNLHGQSTISCRISWFSCTLTACIMQFESRVVLLFNGRFLSCNPSLQSENA